MTTGETSADHLELAAGPSAVSLSFWRTSDADEQERLLERIEQMLGDEAVREEVRSHALFRSHDGSRLALYRLFGPEVSGRDLPELTSDFPPSDAEVYALRLQVPEGRNRIVVAGDQVALGEFWVEPGGLDELIAREPEAARQALGSSGILSASFHVSVDGRRIVNLAQITSPEAVARLAAVPGFDAATGYWRAFARNEHHTYDVVSVSSFPVLTGSSARQTVEHISKTVE